MKKLTVLFIVFFFCLAGTVVGQDSIAVKVMKLEDGKFELLLTGGNNVKPEDLYFDFLPEIGRIADTVAISYFVNLKKYKVGRKIFVGGSGLVPVSIILSETMPKNNAGVITLLSAPVIVGGIAIPLMMGKKERHKIGESTHRIIQKFFIYEQEITYISEEVPLKE